MKLEVGGGGGASQAPALPSHASVVHGVVYNDQSIRVCLILMGWGEGMLDGGQSSSSSGLQAVKYSNYL